MVLNAFEALLQELARALQIDQLKPDSNNSCLIQMPNGPKVQLEVNKQEDRLIMGSNLGFLPVGRYREDVFREALKANNLPPPRYGTFAYSKKADQLILFDSISLTHLNGEKIAQHLTPFVEKVTHWQEAITRGEIPAILGAFSTRKAGTGMFGL